ncbi:MAG: ABC transporter permease [Bacilli bacterium]|nr:ABC transporter permease [Bacilli bacterium]
MGKIKVKFFDFLNKNSTISILSSIVCIILGILVGFLLLLVTKPGESLIGITSIIFKPFSPTFFNKYFIGAIVKSVPLIFSGLSVAFAFKTGLFNIGTPGQMLVGGFTAVAISLLSPIHNGFTMILAIIGAIIAGAIWGLIVGFLKAKFNINEVIAAIMMNYIGTYLVIWLVQKDGIYNAAYAMSKPLPSYAIIPTLGLDKLFPGSYLDISIFIAIAIAILLYFVLNKTTLGFELKATGFNKDAANNASMKYKRNIIISMTIAGALAGLGGAILYMSSYGGGIKPEITLLSAGFDGISVALLASLNPIGAIFSGIFIQYIRNGGQILRIFTSYSTEIADIIIAIIIYFSALTALIVSFFNKRRQNRKEGK